uniref:Uncharacterized protein n=1 Tax=Romanomermis culicivorax TaxID=13658 RepID=A0A915IDX0_ROMCU
MEAHITRTPDSIANLALKINKYVLKSSRNNNRGYFAPRVKILQANTNFSEAKLKSSQINVRHI